MRLLFFHALSPLHAGTGQSTGAIDLPIARDRATGFPCLPASSIKGPLRDLARKRSWKQDDMSALFGPETAQASEHAGALVLGDANLLCMPARSVAGTFGWVTSPYLLRRFNRDLAEAGLGVLGLPSDPASPAECLVTQGSAIAIGDVAHRRVIFEDLDLSAGAETITDTIAGSLAARIFPAGENDQQAWVKLFKSRFCLVHDDVMSFLAEHATDVVARVALKEDAKTVDNLWHEEALPAESILVSLVDALPNRGSRGKSAEDLLGALATLIAGEAKGAPGTTPGRTEPGVRGEAIAGEAKGAPGTTAGNVMQFGGKATVGRGRCRVVLTPPAAPANGGRR